jgi:pimeloyl-ACP methyl ester carboxylesterase
MIQLVGGEDSNDRGAGALSMESGAADTGLWTSVIGSTDPSGEEPRREAPYGRMRQMSATDGLPLCVHEFGDSGAPVLITHPMGYNAAVMAPLARRLTGLRCVAPDFRGHGGTPVDLGYQFPAGCFAEDVVGCARTLAGEANGVVGVGHSMGAAALVLAEAMFPGTFDRLYLYEPAIMPPDVGRRLNLENPNVARMLRRRKSFASHQAVYERYSGLEPFKDFAEDALEAYIQHGFVEESDGSVRLACLPEFEVRITVSGMVTLAFERLGDVRCPVVVARGTSPNNRGRAGHEAAVAERLPFGGLVYLDGLTHFGPQQHPDLVARSVLDAVA